MDCVKVLYGATVFLGAFLLFQVQPIIGKYILPWFGGSPAVWNTCLLFFQLLLLGGYSYAHLSVRRLRRPGQVFVHLLLLSAMILSLPLLPSGSWKPGGHEDPVWRILLLLSATVGIPYFLLSATGPLLQAWYSRSHGGISPYRFYALSNLGSLLALCSYPFVVEPALPLSYQARVWSVLCSAFALSCAACALMTYRWRALVNPDGSSGAARMTITTSERSSAPKALGDAALWFGLSACGSGMLLATTNQMCQDVAVVPFLWVLPLALYLLTFVICFSKEAWYGRAVFGCVWIAAVIQACVVLYKGIHLDLPLQIGSYAFTLLAGCMVLHGELIRLKPEPARLTLFYLAISGGGAAGGIFVTFIAPYFFKGFWEFHLSVAAAVLLWLIALCRDKRVLLFRDGRPRWPVGVSIVAYSALLVALGLHAGQNLEDDLETTRSFYGVLRVREDDRENPGRHRYTLMHGRIEHGFQFRDGEKRYWPTSYYGPGSGVGLAITFHQRRLSSDRGARNLRVGVVGLGTGTIASYGEAGDYLRFYEINPGIVRLSQKYFSYLRDTKARVDVVLGDARLSMERELASGLPQQFDVLAIDAFSSDAIPVHLLTEECFRVYWRHLKEDGILAVHVSSRYFDLSPIARMSSLFSKGSGVSVMRTSNEGNDSQGTDSSDWVLATTDRKFLESPAVQMAAKEWTSGSGAHLRWTDDYSNLFEQLTIE